MTATTLRACTLTAALAWFAVGGYGVTEALREEGDGGSGSGSGSYLVFSAALLIGAVFTITVAAWVSRQGGRRRLRTAGLVVCGVGALASIVAWALPLWMSILAVGLAMVAGASATRPRRALALLAGAPVVGLGVLFAGLIAKIGERDEWGDYPMAGEVALVVTAALAIAALKLCTTAVAVTPPERWPSGRAPSELIGRG